MGCGLSKAHSNPEVLVSHGSARLTFHGRRLIVQRHQAGWPQAHIAAAMGVSRKCVKTWIDRYATEGDAGLVTRSSRPHTMPTKTSEELEQKVLAARSTLREGPDVLGPRVGVPPRTVSRILRRHSVPYLRECDRITGEMIRSSKQTAVRYERGRPGELVHMDVKKIGRIPDGGGWRTHGRGAVPRDRSTKVGYDYVHSLIDDHSRLAYRYSLRAVCAAHGITQKFIKPHCPWQNGKVERLNRTLATEWAYRQVFTTNDQRAAALAPWLQHYNTERHHSALGGKPPISRLPPT